MVKEFAQSWLVCPATRSPLYYKKGLLSSSEQSYPSIDGIPWLFKDPKRAMAEWSAKIQDHVAAEKLYLKHTQINLNTSKDQLANKRVSRQHEARTRNLALMQKTLSDFLKQKPGIVLPSTQQIYSYFQLFFRDWCWDSTEIDLYVDFVAENLRENAKSVLILGSGAGGLSYRLARRFPGKQFCSVEHNPFLAIMAEKIMQGKTVKLFDYTAYPNTLENAAQKWEIRTDKLDADNHQSVMCAFPDLPFAEQSFDVVIAPWFLDILELPFSTALDHAIRFLKDDGQFLFFGPANVHKPAELDQLCCEEVESHFDARFTNMESASELMLYLRSPLESQNREEKVLFVNTNGVLNRNQTSDDNSYARWIKFTPEFERFKIENETFHKILSHIQGDMGYRDLANILEREYGFESSESEHYAQTFIKRIEMQIY